jgi:hypothetical protein
VREALLAQGGDAPPARDVLLGRLRGALRRFIHQRYDRKPIVLPIVLEV